MTLKEHLEQAILGLTKAGAQWDEFCTQQSVVLSVFGGSSTVTPEIWTAWFREKAHPLNREIRDNLTVVFPAELTRPLHVELFLDYVERYEALLERWTAGDTSDLHIGSNFPRGLEAELAAIYLHWEES